MGFNIGVGGVKNRADYESSKFVARSYYVFTTSYEMYGDESVLIKSGEYFNLDLKPLGIHLYLENEFDTKEEEKEYLNSRKISIKHVLPILKEFRKLIMNESDYLEKVIFDSKESINQKDYFLKYTSSNDIIIDLNNIIESIELYKEKGETQIYFEAG